MVRLAFVLAIGFARVASASPAEAEVLFREGRTLLKQGMVDAACDRFERSYKLEPSITTLLNLGDCHQQGRRTATAWDIFLKAKALALKNADPRRAAEADRRAKVLEPELARLTVTVGEDRRISGLVIRRNRTLVVDSAIWNSAVPIDPGDHQIEATAPGRLRWTTQITVRPKDSAIVIVEPLVIDPAGAPTLVPAPIISRDPDRAGAIGVLFGAGERENTLIGARGLISIPMPGGELRGIASAHFTRYVDGRSMDLSTDLRTDNVAIGVGGQYLYFPVPQFGFGGGLGIGVDLDFPLDTMLRPLADRGSDVGAWLMLRVSPAVVRLSTKLEASLEMQVVRGGDEVIVSGIATVDWFLW